MGGSLAFRVGNYNTTAEREQFRILCEKLKTRYQNSGEFCVFAGNYNIGCELDAIFFKSDAIITIEFKNYGGLVIANENGEWKADGVTIKGGSRKTVLQQARVNHSIVKKELKALGVEKKQIQDVPHLIVFHQPIELDNRLSATTKSWLYVTDTNHFIEKLDDITCPHTDLDSLKIAELADLLNLNPFFLDDFSSASCENIENDCEQSNNVINETAISNDCVITSSCDIQNVAPISHDKYNEEEIELINFVNNVLSIILKNSQYEISLYNSALFMSKFLNNSVTSTRMYIVTVKGIDVEKYVKKISDFIYRDVKILYSGMIYWEAGQELNSLMNTELQDTEQLISNSISKSHEVVKFRKSRTILPLWLDKCLFENHKAQYAPKHTRFEYNLDLTDSEVKIYLGTYFPRSYAESFCIYENLFTNHLFYHEFSSKSEIRILDVGCGTGGELIGLIVSLSKNLTNSISINIDACDGNEISLKTLKNIMETVESHTHHIIHLSLHNKIFYHTTKVDNKEFSGNQYDIILCNKLVCELLSHNVIRDNAYKKLAKSLCSILSKNGILLLLDVTTKDVQTGYFYPQIMNSELNSFVQENKEYATLIPLACSIVNCKEPCFMQQTFVISHSRISCDESRVCYRILCHKDFKEKLFPVNIDNTQHVINSVKYKDGDKSAVCDKIYGKNIIDTFNINQ